MSDEMDGDSIAERLVRAREAAEFSTAQLARRIGVQTRTLSAWETGRAEPRANRLAMIAGILGVSPTWLLVGRGQAPAEAGGELALIRGEIAQLRRQHAAIGRVIARLEAHLADLAGR